MNKESGISICTVIFIVLFVLKLMGLINLSWIWVTCTIWIPIVFSIIILIGFVLYIIICNIVFGILNKRHNN